MGAAGDPFGAPVPSESLLPDGRCGIRTRGLNVANVAL